jgi:monofunctional biosynthetic peptidoglycan transglycosylase
MPHRVLGHARWVLRWLGGLVLAGVLLSLLLVLPWRWLPPPTSSFIVQYWVSQSTAPDYQWVNYQDIAPIMALAVVAGEDQRFPTHKGFDLREIRQAIADYRAGKPLRGASTISQQVAKNLYLWPSRSVPRKLLEAWFTLLIEATWPKQRILEVYLNMAQFSQHQFGVEAASQYYFNKPARELTANEAALLAAVLPAPVYYRIDQPSEQVRFRQGWILRQMNQLGGSAYLRNL